MTEGTPSISIITVVRNNPNAVRAVNSVLAQACPGGIESIVIDGASTDGTLEALLPLQHRLAHLISEPDGGIYHAMNKGIALAKGDVIGTLNADDIYAGQDTLERVWQAFQDPDVDVVFGDLVMVREGNEHRHLRYWRTGHFCRGSFRWGWMPPHPTFFARRRLFETFGGFDLSFAIAADFDLMLRFLECHDTRAVYIPSVLVQMRAGGASNGSLTGIWKANRECARSFRVNGISPGPFFVPMKLARHALQLLRRAPAPESGHSTHRSTSGAE